MRTFIASLMASAFVIAGFSAANAADAVDQVPEAPVAQAEPAAPAGNWEGFYLGGAGTYNKGNFGADRDGYAMGGQLYTGYNWQSGQIVYGVEADLGYSGLDSTSDGITNKNRFNGSVRGRVGYDLNPFLLYATAGAAAANNKVSGFGQSDTNTAFGYTVGAGAEAMVTNNITARVEYRFSDYQNKDFDLGATNVSRGYDEHSVKVGIGVKF